MTATKAFAVLVLLACLAAPTQALARRKNVSKQPTMFKQLGGQKAITAVVEDFVGRCATDDRIASFFKDTAADPKRLKKFKNNLVMQLCQVTGGPCKYKGMNMKAAHKNMNIQEVHFNALVENLNTTLDKFQVSPELKEKLVAKLAPLKEQIVEGPTRETASDPQ